MACHATPSIDANANTSMPPPPAPTAGSDGPGTRSMEHSFCFVSLCTQLLYTCVGKRRKKFYFDADKRSHLVVLDNKVKRSSTSISVARHSPMPFSDI